MGFVNEKMTKEERAEFEAKAIPNPGFSSSIMRPDRWTINREEDVYFVWGQQDRNNPSDYSFLLGWKGVPIPVELREYWVQGSPRTWELRRIKIPVDLQEKRNEIIQNLKEALIVYGFDGDPNWANNKTTKVQFSF